MLFRSPLMLGFCMGHVPICDLDAELQTHSNQFGHLLLFDPALSLQPFRDMPTSDQCGKVEL